MRKHTIFVLLALLVTPTLLAAQQQGQMQRQQAMQRVQQHMEQMIQRMDQVQERLQTVQQQIQQQMQAGPQVSEQHRQQNQHMNDVATSMQEMAGQIRNTMMQVRTLAQNPAMHEEGAMRQEMERLREHLQGIVDELVAGAQALEQMQRRAGEVEGGS